VEYTEISIDQSTLNSTVQDIVIAELGEMGFESFMEENQFLRAYIPSDAYNESDLKQLSAQYDGFSYSAKVIPQQNWNAQWESNFSPISIDRYCLIRAPFHETGKGYDFEIEIEPKMSFGTGHHATTRLMIMLMQRTDMKSKQVLDMGCGTGVLGIIAKMTGAGAVDGIDIDQWAVENTIENAARNSVNFDNVMLGDAKQIKRNYDVILANINRNILLADMEQYAEHLNPEGYLFLSGFLEADKTIVAQKAKIFQLTLTDQLSEDQWQAMVFKASN